jgi:hypothetical protein
MKKEPAQSMLNTSLFSIALLAATLGWPDAASAQLTKPERVGPPVARAETRCDVRSTLELGEVGGESLVVESLGPCPDALVLIWIDRPDRRHIGDAQALHLARLAQYGRSFRDLEGARVAVDDVVSRIELDARSGIETWSDLQHAGDQPGGAPWRGTPLQRTDYERIAAAGTRVLLIPTDATRYTLVAWDDEVAAWVDVIYYGD